MLTLLVAAPVAGTPVPANLKHKAVISLATPSATLSFPTVGPSDAPVVRRNIPTENEMRILFNNRDDIHAPEKPVLRSGRLQAIKTLAASQQEPHPARLI